MEDRPISCTPTGKPFAVSPQGIVSAGTPARFAGRFRRSSRARVEYSQAPIFVLSSPMSGAAMGFAGAIKAFTPAFVNASDNCV